MFFFNKLTPSQPAIYMGWKCDLSGVLLLNSEAPKTINYKTNFGHIFIPSPFLKHIDYFYQSTECPLKLWINQLFDILTYFVTPFHFTPTPRRAKFCWNYCIHLRACNHTFNFLYMYCNNHHELFHSLSASLLKSLFSCSVSKLH